MNRHRTVLLAVALLAGVSLAGCGGTDDVPTAKSSSPSSPDPTLAPTSSTPTATATRTGPSGDTPSERRDELGGCPAPEAIEEIAGTPVTRATDPGPTVICSYTSTRTKKEGAVTAPVLEVSVSEPVGLAGQDSLAGYRRTVERSNPAAPVTGLGDGAFASYFDDAPRLCAVWFTAEDDKILTVSVLTRLAPATETAGPSSGACADARDVAAGFRN